MQDKPPRRRRRLLTGGRYGCRGVRVLCPALILCGLLREHEPVEIAGGDRAGSFWERAEMPGTPKNRPDRVGKHRVEFDRNKRRILATQDTCALCGQPVDKSLKFPHPLSPTIDHIIPVAKGGHPSALDNLQLAHFTCNRAKSAKLLASGKGEAKAEQIGNRELPQSRDWTSYRAQ